MRKLNEQLERWDVYHTSTSPFCGGVSYYQQGNIKLNIEAVEVISISKAYSLNCSKSMNKTDFLKF